MVARGFFVHHPLASYGAPQKMPKTAVVALGGNAFTRAGISAGSYEGQIGNALKMAQSRAGHAPGWLERC